MNPRRILSSIFSLSLCLALAFIVSGCSSAGSRDKALAGGEYGDASELSEYDLDMQRERRYGDGNIPAAEGEGIFRDVRFDYDSSTIGDAARQNIEYNVEILKANPGLRVQLEGHCDERGTAEYNMALGSRRAESVRDVLVSYGISPSRIDTISYGEEVPLDASNSEAAYAKNRRVHFSAFRSQEQR